MAKKNKKKNDGQAQAQAPVHYGPQLVYRVVPKGMPIVSPATHIQLTPIVQPVALVPYSTQAQPIQIFDEGDGYYDD